MNIYQDESGCLGFKAGSSKYFVIVLLCTEKSKRLGNIIRKEKGKLIKAGWPKEIEIKANHLYYAPRDEKIPVAYKYKYTPEKPIISILKRLCDCEIEIDAIVVMKERIHYDLRDIPNGILLNYFSARVLIDR